LLANIKQHAKEFIHRLDVAELCYYGQSITDGCIDWDSSITVLEGLAQAVRQRRLSKSE
jgi:phospho-2-dehydro-3-deoxyheptonate aldolase